MDRRKFVQQSILGVSAFSILASDSLRASNDESVAEAQRQGAEDAGSAQLTADEIQRYLRSLGAEWVDAQRTVDTFKAGKPETIVTGVAVGWMSYFAALRKAKELGCNLFVTHEPTYYDHFDRDASVFAFDTARQKKRFIEESGMAIIRCHDVWDRVPEIGIRDAWASFLGLKKEIDRRISSDGGQGRPFCGVYEISPQTAVEFARQVASKLVRFQQTAVQLIGPAGKTVRTVAVGTGAITPFRQMVSDLQADTMICTDDGFSYWRDGALAMDMQYPVIVVNHPCSEEIGMRRLAGMLADKFPQVPVHHIAQSCMFQSITGTPDA